MQLHCSCRVHGDASFRASANRKKLLLYRLRIKFPIHDVVIQVIHARRLIAIMENSKNLSVDQYVFRRNISRSAGTHISLDQNGDQFSGYELQFQGITHYELHANNPPHAQDSAASKISHEMQAWRGNIATCQASQQDVPNTT